MNTGFNEWSTHYIKFNDKKIGKVKITLKKLYFFS